MKILFLCGCFESGRDGVGDYCRILGGALINQGHAIEVIAFNDIHLKEDIKVEIPGKEGADIKALRLGYKQTSTERLKNAKMHIKNFNPDLISLQYVPYSFQKKGLPVFLIPQLKKIGANYCWHIMFHELWVGVSRISPSKHRLVGFFQRKIVQKLVKELKPKLITTSNLMYQTILNDSNIQSEILPLFSNIPKTAIDQSYKRSILNRLNLENSYKESHLLAGVFGTIHHDARLVDRLLELENSAKNQSKELIFISLGRSGKFGDEELDRLKEKFNGRIQFLKLGEISTIKISTLLQMLDFGISCTPFEYLSKSGVYAAMKLHNLEVITTNNHKLPEYKEEIENAHEHSSQKEAEEWNVEFIAGNYLSLLKYKNYDLSPTNTGATRI